MSSVQSKALSDVQSQIQRFKLLLEGKTLDVSSPVFENVLTFLRSGIRLPESEKPELSSLIQRTFCLSEEGLIHKLSGANSSNLDRLTKRSSEIESKELELFSLLPQDSWFTKYVAFASNSEVPLAYHVFSSLILVGACMGRRVWFDMGYFRIFPPMGVFLLGPSGLKKTTASDIAIDISNRVKLATIYSEKITPEALALAFSTDAQGIIYAPEATVLMGKQKYNEGLIPFITRLMDCPASLTPTTIIRGAIEIKNIAASVLGCSTTDWFIENTPKDIFGGGFIARMILVHQMENSKSFPFPTIDSVNTPTYLGKELLEKRSLAGPVIFSDQAKQAYISWYHENKKSLETPSYEILVSYLKRKPIHVLRLALNLHIMAHSTLEICLDCFERAIKILLWNEYFLPPMLEELFKTPDGRDHDYVLRQVLSEGGVVTHVKLVRKVQHRMTAQRLKAILYSLKEAKHIEESSDSLSHYWRLI